GGAWSESCPSDPVDLGFVTGGGLTLSLPVDFAVEAQSAAGAPVSYPPSPADAAGQPVAIDCRPPPGATFPIGLTNVLCSAQDQATGGVSLGAFSVIVVAGPPRR